MVHCLRWLLALSLGSATSASAGVAAYRCQGPDGKVTYADRPCELGQPAVGAKGASAAAGPASAASAAPANNSAASAARASPARAAPSAAQR